jgi:GNAT superfamily N-acetyltransferase
MNSNEITLHQAREADIDMIVDMRTLFADELAGKQDSATEQSMRACLKEYFAEELNKTCICWYATVNEQPVSIVAVVLRKQPGSLKNPTGKWGYFMNVYTLPSFRRMGISSLLLNKAIEHAVSLGYTAFELHATKDGEPTYIKNGFTLHAEPTYRKFF